MTRFTKSLDYCNVTSDYIQHTNNYYWTITTKQYLENSSLFRKLFKNSSKSILS